MFFELLSQVTHVKVNILLSLKYMIYQSLTYKQTIIFLKSSVWCFSRHRTPDNHDNKQNPLQCRFLPTLFSRALQIIQNIERNKNSQLYELGNVSMWKVSSAALSWTF